MQSRSSIDWTTNAFKSNITLDTEKAGLSMPSGKNAAINRIETQLPDLVKDPLLSIFVNSEEQLSDLILNETLDLGELDKIVDSGKQSPAIFVGGTYTIQTTHSINLLEISETLIKHKYTYKNPKPIETTASRVYTGIIIDARGTLPVQGEFTSDSVYPCFFPKIWDDTMELIYERNMGESELEKLRGMVLYGWSDNEELYYSRVGKDPLRINARKVYGRFRTDPVISRNDALKLLSIPQNLQLLKEGKVVILLDKDNLVYDISVPERNESYYTAYTEVRNRLLNSDDAPEIENTIRGIEILYDLKFEPDSAVLLDSELPKVQTLAETLLKINADNSFTILVEGHTADLNKPEGQMRLSIERTQTIINELVKNGLDRSIFSYRGYGGTQPIAPNDTPEGRAQNRRVIITAQPRATYIQRY